MKAAISAVRTARKARVCLRGGELELAVRLIAAAGTQVGLIVAAPQLPHVTAVGLARSYMRASNVWALVVGEVAREAGSRHAVLVARGDAMRSNDRRSAQ